MIRRPPRATLTDTPFPTRRSSDLGFLEIIERILADIGVPIVEVELGLLAVRERFSAIFAAGGETAETDPDRRDAECLEQRATPARLLDQFVEIPSRPPCMRRQADPIGAAGKDR